MRAGRWSRSGDRNPAGAGRQGARPPGEAGLSSERDLVLLDLKERARFYASLTDLGFPRAAGAGPSGHAAEGSAPSVPPGPSSGDPAAGLRYIEEALQETLLHIRATLLAI